MQLWKRLVSVAQRSEVHQKMEFCVMVYFTVFPVHPANGKGKDGEGLRKRMDEFKTYLDSKGAEFASSPEFLPFYAFPYIKNPQEHQSFASLFTKEWSESLRKKLKEYLEQTLPSLEPPVISKMWEAYQKDNGNSRIVNISPLKKKHEELRKSWLEFGDSALGAAKELLAMVRTKAVSEDRVKSAREYIERCEKFLEEHKEEEAKNEQNETKDELSQELNKQLQEKKSKDIHRPIEQVSEKRDSKLAESFRPQNPSNSSNLDYAKIKTFMLVSADELKLCTLLQALARRIIEKKSKAEKVEMIAEYVHNDLLDCSGGHFTIKRLLEHSNEKVVENAMLLMDELVDEKVGLVYVISQETMSLLVGVLTSEPRNSPLMQAALGVIEKCSVKRKAQLSLIQLGIVSWIISMLESYKDLDMYTLEYVTALLMNLSLRLAGKKACLNPNLRVLETLVSMLDVDNNDVKTYVNGAIYSLLSLPEFKARAKDMNLVERLKELKAKSNELVATQLQYMIEQVNSEYTEEDNSQSDDDIESDYNDNVEVSQDFCQEVPAGEALLSGEFALNGSGEVEAVLESYEKIPEDVLARANERSKKRPGLKEMVIYPVGEQQIPVVIPLEYPKRDKEVPLEMESRPKIPRTPIPEEKLEKVKKENEKIRKNSMHVYINEEANIKKQKMRRYKPPQTARRRKGHPVKLSAILG
eukprot:TRINITY_DN1226_c0_g3_i6.p1 TRINITY_DN1226_c0_g3~~TRINITY_DN1226_c0_g3_i6.p1  ORF type:complete len:697 (-),score=219.60 TRINITY_DN1226_c0_g3_i6:239-2329(-)